MASPGFAAFAALDFVFHSMGQARLNSSLPGVPRRAENNGANSRAGMKKKKKKLVMPRRQWLINPATRVKESEKRYLRAKARRVEQQVKYEE
jgi:hypothetical protein